MLSILIKFFLNDLNLKVVYSNNLDDYLKYRSYKTVALKEILKVYLYVI